MTGRPSKRTDQIVRSILDGLAVGTPLTVLCRQIGVCDDTVRNWAEGDEELSRAIARAREAGEDWLAYEGLTIVDNTEEDPASRRVRSDYRLKLLAKFNPNRWGDRQSIEHTGKLSLESLVAGGDTGPAE